MRKASGWEVSAMDFRHIAACSVRGDEAKALSDAWKTILVFCEIYSEF